jgi:AcrR family transcriptional regulator
LNRGSEDLTRQRLLEVAEEHFGTRSYEKTTVAEIAKQTGIAIGSFYRYFNSKEDVLIELLRHLNRAQRAEMGAAIEGATDQREIERRGFIAFFRFFHCHPHLFRIQRQVEFVDPAAHREYFEELARRYARRAKEAMVRGEVDDRFDPEFLAYVYIGVAHLVGMRWIEWTHGGTMPEDILEQVLFLLEKALRPED